MSTTDCGAPSELAKNATKSEVKLEYVTHLWAINNFDFCEATKNTIISPEFSGFTNDEAIWSLSLKPCGNCTSPDHISLHLVYSEKSEHETVFAKCQFYILDEELKKEDRGFSGTFIELNRDVSWGCDRFCEKDENFRVKYLSKNVLKILCEVTYSTETDFMKHHRYQDKSHAMPTFADRDVTENLDMLFKTHFLADVVISVQGRDFPAHKAILAARCKVFAAMFQHDTKEKEENRIEIKEMSEEIANEMLRFIYTGRCENLYKLAGELLVAADRYDLDLLKTICADNLCENLSIKNAVENLILADKHSVDALKSEVINFIVDQPTEVFDSDGWKSMLLYPSLIDEVCRAVTQKPKEISDDSDQD